MAPAQAAARPGDGFCRPHGAAARPLSGRHRIALDNLRLAYPELDQAAHREIALDMWENMARLGAEYIFLDQLFDFDPNARKPGRVEVVGAERFLRLRDEKKPHILFTGHLGNSNFCRSPPPLSISIWL